MNPQIQFQAGNFRRYVAARNFALGNSGQTLSAGSEVEFDGTNYMYSGSAPAPLPQLRGAIKAGWLVLAENYDPEDLSASIPQPAGVRMRSATGGNPMDPQPRHSVVTTDAEEREVGNVAAHAQQTRTANTNYGRPGQRSSAAASNVMASAQDGREVRKLSNPAFAPPVDLEKTTATEAIRQIDRATKIQPGVGLTREQLVAQLPEEEREAYLAEMEARRMSHIAEDHPQAMAERERNRQALARQGRLDDAVSPKVVGRVASTQNTSKEGFNITNHVGGGVETVDLSGLDSASENKVTTTVQDGITFTNTNIGPAKPVAPKPSVPMDNRRRIAKSICPDFPDNYGFDDPVRKKIARLQADYDDRPDVIRAVAAADTDEELRDRLVEEFPEAFT